MNPNIDLSKRKTVGISLSRDEFFYTLAETKKGREHREVLDEIYLKKLNGFFERRPALSIEKFCEEAGISTALLGEVLLGKQPLKQDFIEKVVSFISKYGGMKQNF